MGKDETQLDESNENFFILKLKSFFDERFDRLENKLNPITQILTETETRSKQNKQD